MEGLDFHTFLWVAIAILVVIWLIGLFARGAKRLIHIALIVAVLLVLYNVFLR
jgi:hypothetical protein